MNGRVEMLNGITGTTMLVPEELVEMYIKAGHSLAKRPAAPADTKNTAPPKKRDKAGK